MHIFVDTSAALAVLNREDLWAVRAAHEWRKMVENRDALHSTSYVVLETISILQRRIGLSGIKVFCDTILPMLAITHVDADLHTAALSHLLVANRRELSRRFGRFLGA